MVILRTKLMYCVFNIYKIICGLFYMFNTNKPKKRYPANPIMTKPLNEQIEEQNGNNNMNNNMNTNNNTNNINNTNNEPNNTIGFIKKGNRMVFGNNIGLTVNKQERNIDTPIPTQSLSNYIPILFGMYINGSEYVKYNEKNGTSIFNPLTCSNDDGLQNKLDMYNYKKFTYAPKIELPINLIAKNNPDYYEYHENNESIIIKEKGYYKITYNITYHGSVYNPIFNIIVTDINTQKTEHILYSIHKNNTGVNNDTDNGLYDYEGNNVSVLDDLINTTSHNFLLPIKETGIYAIKLMIKLTESNKNKSIYVHPVKTWIAIEKLAN